MPAQCGEGAAQAHVGTRGAGGIGQDAGQYRPQDRAAARHIGRGQAWRGQFGNLRAMRQAQAYAVTGGTFAQEGVEHAQLLQGAQGGRAQADAGAIVAPLGIKLDQFYVCATAAQVDGGRHAGKTAADDEDALRC